MGIFNFFNKNQLNDMPDENIVSICTGKIIKPSEIEDEMFSSERMGKTIAFIPEDKEIVSPCNGTVEVLFPTGHAFAIRSNTGAGILVHIGINTVDLNGDGFKMFAKQGMKVKAGQKIIEVDFNKIKKASLPITTMMIVTEPENNKEYKFKQSGKAIKREILL